MGDWRSLGIEMIGWASTLAFLLSILHPNRSRLHQMGIFTAVTTTIYAYAHGATAIWVKWVCAFFVHAYMIWKLRSEKPSTTGEAPEHAVDSDPFIPS